MQKQTIRQLNKIDKALTSIPLPIYSAAIFLLIFAVGVMVYDRVNYIALPNSSINIQETIGQQINLPAYKVQVLMGVSPNMESRTPTRKDIDTQLNLQSSDGKVFRLFESRDPNDFFNYGKTFVVRIK